MSIFSIFTRQGRKDSARRSKVKKDMKEIRKIGQKLDKTPRYKVGTRAANYARAIGISIRVIKTKAIG